jgi:hypothetical protein
MIDSQYDKRAVLIAVVCIPQAHSKSNKPIQSSLVSGMVHTDEFRR